MTYYGISKTCMSNTCLHGHRSTVKTFMKKMKIVSSVILNVTTVLRCVKRAPSLGHPGDE